VIDQSDPFLDYDAAYVMGALDPHDRRAFEEHLSTCHRCSAAVSELAGMPGLLAQVPTEQVLAPRATPEPVPDTLLPRLAAAIRAQQRRRRVWTSVVAAAAACLVTGVVLTASPWSSPEPEGTVLAMTAVTSAPVTATVRLDSVDWGTRVNLECTYQEAPSGEKWGARTYKLVVVPRDGGDVQQVAEWTALPGKTVTPTGSTSLTTEQIEEIRLLNSRGDTLLHVVPTA
jgi:anti-sigma-K factor RskA